MKIIVYENRNDLYECTYLRDDGSDKIKIVFDEPWDAKLTANETVFSISHGICVLDISDLCDGEILPKLFVLGKTFCLEGFIMKDGALIGKIPDESYIRNLSKRCEDLSLRLSKAESEIKNIYEKMEQKINF